MEALGKDQSHLAVLTENSGHIGGRQTDIGTIPDGWDVQPLSQLLDFQNGFNAEKSSYGRGVPFANVLEVITKSHLTEVDIPGCVAVTANQLQAFLVRPGDILFNRTSETQDELGLASVYVGSGQIIFGGFVIRGRIKSNRLDATFAGYLLRAPAVRRQIVSRGQGAVRANIGQSELGSVMVPLPPSHEQVAIAEALGEYDSLIAELEKLIEKKKLIKRRAVLELLTGKRRLPGFNGEWVQRRLGSDAILKARIGWQGLTTAEYLENGEYLLVTGTEFRDGGIDWESCFFVDETRYGQDKNIQLSIGDVLVTKDGTIGKTAYVSSLPLRATLNSGVFLIRPKENRFSSQYFYYVMSSNIFTSFLNKLSAGSTINHLYQKDFVNFIFDVPHDITEQSAIVDTLSSMDEEIAVLERRLKKIKELRQGMMQELLTGRVRLV